MSKKYEIVEVSGTEVTVDVSLLTKSEDLFFNATQIATQFGKRPEGYLRLDGTNAYIEALISRYPDQGNELIKKKQGGRYQGTWLHQKLAIDFARWLSAPFAVELDAWVAQRVADDKLWQQSRLAARTGYLPMSQAIEDDHDPAKFYHYSNEANMINKIVLGMSSKDFKEKYDVEDVRDGCTAAQLRDLDNIQSMNTSLIKLELDYSDRKSSLTNYHSKNQIE